MELLFWKNTHQAVEMVEGYDIQVENKKLKRTGWTETEEDELRTLFMEHQTNKQSQGNFNISFSIFFLFLKLYSLIIIIN